MTNQSNETNTTHLLDALTDAIFRNQDGLVDSLFDQYNIPKGSLGNMLELVHQLKGLFAPTDPSEEYIRALKQELIGAEDTLISRMRYLPARVQVAAGLAVIAGFFLLSRRRLISDETTPEFDIPALQQ